MCPISSLFRLTFENMHLSHKKLGGVKIHKDEYVFILRCGQLKLIKPTFNKVYEKC